MDESKLIPLERVPPVGPYEDPVTHMMRYSTEYILNNGFFLRACEWPCLVNNRCHYIKSGCTGCSINSSLDEAISLIGKALTDGVSSLIKSVVKVGVQFDWWDRLMIRSYHRFGFIAKAQQYILKRMKGDHERKFKKVRAYIEKQIQRIVRLARRKM